jgi:hypothetical protein
MRAIVLNSKVVKVLTFFMLIIPSPADIVSSAADLVFGFSHCCGVRKLVLCRRC